MAMVHRGNKRYYYRSIRVNGRVTRLYCGKGEAADQAEENHKKEQAIRTEIREERQEARYHQTLIKAAIALVKHESRCQGMHWSGGEWRVMSKKVIRRQPKPIRRAIRAHNRALIAEADAKVQRFMDELDRATGFQPLSPPTQKTETQTTPKMCSTKKKTRKIRFKMKGRTTLRVPTRPTYLHLFAIRQRRYAAKPTGWARRLKPTPPYPGLGTAHQAKLEPQATKATAEGVATPASRPRRPPNYARGRLSVTRCTGTRFKMRSRRTGYSPYPSFNRVSCIPCLMVMSSKLALLVA